MVDGEILGPTTDLGHAKFLAYTGAFGVKGIEFPRACKFEFSEPTIDIVQEPRNDWSPGERIYHQNEREVGVVPVYLSLKGKIIFDPKSRWESLVGSDFNREMRGPYLGGKNYLLICYFPYDETDETLQRRIPEIQREKIANDLFDILKKCNLRMEATTESSRT